MKKILLFGLKKDNYALWIDEDFTRGISGSYCETYNSECLASGEDFDVLNVEIYGID